jgi:hypothetical protein
LTPDLTEKEKTRLIKLLTSKINYDRYPLSPRLRILKGILAKIEPQPAVTTAPLSAAKPGDQPRAALAAMKGRRRG